MLVIRSAIVFDLKMIVRSSAKATTKYSPWRKMFRRELKHKFQRKGLRVEPWGHPTLISLAMIFPANERKDFLSERKEWSSRKKFDGHFELAKASRMAMCQAESKAQAISKEIRIESISLRNPASINSLILMRASVVLLPGLKPYWAALSHFLFSQSQTRRL